MNAQVTGRTNSAFVVTRAVSMPGVHDPDALAAVRAQLERRAGVLSVRPDGKRARVRITYDASQVGFEDLAAELADAGSPMAGGVWNHLKRLWFGYLDGNAKANAGGGNAACCSRPSDIYASRSRKQ